MVPPREGDRIVTLGGAAPLSVEEAVEGIRRAGRDTARGHVGQGKGQFRDHVRPTLGAV